MTKSRIISLVITCIYFVILLVEYFKKPAEQSLGAYLMAFCWLWVWILPALVTIWFGEHFGWTVRTPSYLVDYIFEEGDISTTVFFGWFWFLTPLAVYFLLFVIK